MPLKPYPPFTESSSFLFILAPFPFLVSTINGSFCCPCNFYEDVHMLQFMYKLTLDDCHSPEIYPADANFRFAY